jgi:type III restriction enzyme
VKNADDRKHQDPRKSVLLSPEFKALWDRIKHKTTYRVEFDNDKLIERCIGALDNAPPDLQDPLAMEESRAGNRQGGC